MNNLNEEQKYDYTSTLSSPEELKEVLSSHEQSEQFLIGYLQDFSEHISTLQPDDSFSAEGLSRMQTYLQTMVENHVERDPQKFQFSLQTIMPLFSALEQCKNEDVDFKLNWETQQVPTWAETSFKLSEYVKAEQTIDPKYARTLEKFYVDPKHTLAIHGSCAIKEHIPSFFDKGLVTTEVRNNVTMGKVGSMPNLSYTALIQSDDAPLVSFLNYTYRQNGSNISVVLPTEALDSSVGDAENPIAIWQQQKPVNGVDNDFAYLTPSYVLGGYIPATNEFIENPNFNPDEKHTPGEVTQQNLVYEINRSLAETAAMTPDIEQGS